MCDILMVIFSGVLALFTAVLTLVAYWQFQASKKTRRAFVFLKRMNFEPIMLPRGLEGYKEGHKWMFSPLWRNSGDTPTNNLTISINNRIFDDEIPNDFTFPYVDLKDIPQVIGPNAEIITTPFAIPNDMIDSLRNSQTSHLYIWGEAKYNDVFGNSKVHRTRFCLKMMFLTQQIVGKHDIPIFVWYDRYNCTDEDCDKQS